VLVGSLDDPFQVSGAEVRTYSLLGSKRWSVGSSPLVASAVCHSICRGRTCEWRLALRRPCIPFWPSIEWSKTTRWT